MSHFLISLMHRHGAFLLCLFFFAAFALVAFAILVMLPVDRVDPIPAGITSDQDLVQGDADSARPDYPNEADAFRQLSLQDENGQIPPNALIQAVEHVKQMQAAQQANRPEVAGLFPSLWEALGPGNIGGRVRAILIHPTNPNVMWVGSVSGGVFKTSNGGASWRPTGFIGNLAVTSLVMSPLNSNIIWAATGENFNNGDQIQGEGVFKSVDGGATWTQLPSTANADWYWVNRLAISPDGSTLLAATSSGIQRSTAYDHWTLVRSADFTDVKFHPALTQYAVAGSKTTAYYSVDNGQTWEQSSGLPVGGRVELAYARSAPNTVYASVNMSNNAVGGGEIWKSTNGGQSYSKMTTLHYNYLGNQGLYANTIWVDPTHENILVVGGLDLWRSNDGGVTLTRISDWRLASQRKSAHADHHTIVQSPIFNGTSNKTVFFGNDGGVYKTDNIYTVSAGAPPNGWQSMNNKLGITQFFGAAGNATSGVIVGGTQDNGTQSYSGGTETWQETALDGRPWSGDGGFSASDPTDPDTFYGEYPYLRIHRSTDGGKASHSIYSGLTDAGDPPPVGTGCTLFIAPLILDPNNPNTMYAGGCWLWKSVNVKDSIPTWYPVLSGLSGRISAIAVGNGDPDELWVGTETGAVYHTYNATANSPQWYRDDNTGGLPNRYVTRITINRNVTHDVYVTFGGFDPDNVWHYSLVWQSVNGSGTSALPPAPVRSLVVHPNHQDWLYVGTQVGVFGSEDGGAHWSPLQYQEGPVNVSVDELFWMNHGLVAATHGRGLYRIDLGAQLYSLWTADTNWNRKSTFAPGEPIRYAIAVNNLIGDNLNVGLKFDAYSPDGQLAYTGQRSQSVSPGIFSYGEDAFVPDNAGGTYTFIGSVTYEGHQQRLAITYTVASQTGPLNDNFAAASSLSVPGTASDNTTGATREVGELAPCGSIGSTVWYRVVPDRSGILTANTANSAFDTVLALYTGSSLSGLTNVACNDDGANNTQGDGTSYLTVTVVGGRTYYLQLGGYNGDSGAAQLNVDFAALKRVFLPLIRR
jgi:hypothetical protein